MSTFFVEHFEPVPRNTLLGFAKIRMPSGLVFNDVAIHRAGDSAWAAPPSKPMIGRDGTLMRDPNGKVRYSPVVEFRDKQTRGKWSAEVIAALKASHPGVLS